LALSAATIERVKSTKFGSMAALSRLQEQVGWPSDVPYQLYRLNSGLFDALDWENNEVESKEDFKALFRERVNPLAEYLNRLQSLLNED
jgi:hypothetical protein